MLLISINAPGVFEKLLYCEIIQCIRSNMFIVYLKFYILYWFFFSFWCFGLLYLSGGGRNSLRCSICVFLFTICQILLYIFWPSDFIHTFAFTCSFHKYLSRMHLWAQKLQRRKDIVSVFKLCLKKTHIQRNNFDTVIHLWALIYI